MECPAFTLTLPSEPRFLGVARRFVETVCQSYSMDRSLTHSLVLVAGEAFTNIVRHAHRDLSGTRLEIQLNVGTELVVLTFLDQGEPFDLSRVPNLDPSDLRLGGRGVYLMRRVMDELSCEPRGAGQVGNVLRMVKHLPFNAPVRNCG